MNTKFTKILASCATFKLFSKIDVHWLYVIHESVFDSWTTKKTNHHKNSDHFDHTVVFNCLQDIGNIDTNVLDKYIEKDEKVWTSDSNFSISKC